MSAASVVTEGRKEYKDEQLLARLIGAAVLLFIAVIVLPFVLDGAGSQREYEYAETLPVQPPRPALEQSYSSRQPLPDPPTVEDVPIVTTQAPPVFETPVVSASRNDAVETPPVAAPTESSPPSPAPAAVPAALSSPNRVEPQPIPVGYNIQVASFVKEVNAKKLLDRLSGDNLPSFINQVQGKSQPIIRVFVGPIQSQVDALAIKNQVDKAYRVESILVTRN